MEMPLTGGKRGIYGDWIGPTPKMGGKPLWVGKETLLNGAEKTKT